MRRQTSGLSGIRHHAACDHRRCDARADRRVQHDLSGGSAACSADCLGQSLAWARHQAKGEPMATDGPVSLDTKLGDGRAAVEITKRAGDGTDCRIETSVAKAGNPSARIHSRPAKGRARCRPGRIDGEESFLSAGNFLAAARPAGKLHVLPRLTRTCRLRWFPADAKRTLGRLVQLVEQLTLNQRVSVESCIATQLLARHIALHSSLVSPYPSASLPVACRPART